MIERAPWRMVAGSVAGSSHLRDDRPCEDAHEVCHLGAGCICLAVADGAGSAKFGGLGAATAVAGAVASIRESVASLWPVSDDQWASVVRTAFADALRAIEDRAYGESDEVDARIADFACTLLIAVAGPSWTVGAQVGDGLIALEQGGGLELLTGPERGEYLNETTFLTSSHYEDHVSLSARASAADGLVLMTDGLEPLATNLATGALHPPFFTPLLRFAGSSSADSDQLVEFLGSPRVCERTDDDRTLVIAVRMREVEDGE